MTQQVYYYGTGRRKTSVARVRISPGTGVIVLNGKQLRDILTRDLHQGIATRPLKVTGNGEKFNAQIKVAGGGLSGWAGAISHGIARALAAYDESLKTELRKYKLLTRDPREKERKKYGLKRARKAPQYTKR